MIRNQPAFDTLIAELRGDMQELEHIAALNDRAWVRIRQGARDQLDYGALAFTIHNLYGLFENYFLRISKFFENNLPGDSWHRTLVERMALDIPHTRPALLTDANLAAKIKELLRFRHRFRNMYGDPLDSEKVEAVQTIAQSVITAFPKVHEIFIDKLETIRDCV